MRKRVLYAAALALILLLLVGFTYQAPPPAWEYRVVNSEPMFDERNLKESGRAGWELVTVQQDARGAKTFYFKRPAK